MHSHRCNIPPRCHVIITSLDLTASDSNSTFCTAEQQHHTSQSSATVTSTLCVGACGVHCLKLKHSPCIDLLWPQNVPFCKAGPKPNPIIGVIKMFAITPHSCGEIVWQYKYQPAIKKKKRLSTLFKNDLFGLCDWWRSSCTWPNLLFIPIWIRQWAALTSGQWLHCVPITP